jgi:hypothetical protein
MEDIMAFEKTKTAPELQRRGFLKALGLGAGAAAVGVVGDAAVTPASASESQDERKKSRYRETDHVKTFYRTNRY